MKPTKPAKYREMTDDELRAEESALSEQLLKMRFQSVSGQQDFFSRHIGPWAEHFFTDLEGAQGSVFYAPVGTIGRLFIEIEKDAFRLAGESAA